MELSPEKEEEARRFKDQVVKFKNQNDISFLYKERDFSRSSLNWVDKLRRSSVNEEDEESTYHRGVTGSVSNNDNEMRKGHDR